VIGQASRIQYVACKKSPVLEKTGLFLGPLIRSSNATGMRHGVKDTAANPRDRQESYSKANYLIFIGVIDVVAKKYRQKYRQIFLLPPLLLIFYASRV